MEKKLDGSHTRMLRAILNKSWRQHAIKQQLYGHLRPITKTIKIRRTKHTGHCRRSRDELISDILLWTPLHGRAKAGWPAITYIQQLCADTGCSLEDLPGAIDDCEGRRERVRETHAGGSTLWWWWWYITHTHTHTYIYSYIYIYIYIHTLQTLTYTHTHTHIYTYTHIHTHICIWEGLCMYVCVFAYTHVYIYIYIYVDSERYAEIFIWHLSELSQFYNWPITSCKRR